MRHMQSIIGTLCLVLILPFGLPASPQQTSMISLPATAKQNTSAPKRRRAPRKQPVATVAAEKPSEAPVKSETQTDQKAAAIPLESKLIILFDQHLKLLLELPKKKSDKYVFTLPKSSRCIGPIASLIREDEAVMVYEASGEKVTITCSGLDGRPTFKATAIEPYNAWESSQDAPFLASNQAPKPQINTKTVAFADGPRTKWEYTSNFSIVFDNCSSIEINGTVYHKPPPPLRQNSYEVEVEGNILSVACFKGNGPEAAELIPCERKSKATKPCATEPEGSNPVLDNESIYIYTTKWIKAFEIIPNKQSSKLKAGNDEFREVLKDPHHYHSLAVNGIRLTPNNVDLLWSRTRPPYHIDHYVDSDDCRFYSVQPEHHSVDVGRSLLRVVRKANGIVVGPSKIYDVHALQQMLNNTASQLASISGFDQVSIVKAFGSIQGVTRDTSFVSGQITTAQLPTVDKTVVSDASTAPSGKSTDDKTTTDAKSGGFGGNAPSAPVSSPLTPPSNLSVSSSDILAEQVQLNSQITSLRLLLQGALSDRLVVKRGRAVGTRAQTTLGFPITLNPPRQYKHAAAEVRIIISPPSSLDEPVRIVNLLPEEKTYNVAKVTGHQDQFGAGAIVEAVNLGFNTGRAKDRLFLAKDSDTIAMQYAFPTDPDLELGFWNKIRHGVDEPLRAEPAGDCREVVQDIPINSVVFGWQFRPVLGADYVQAGQRQVFAQLALPTATGQPFIGSVKIQTLWRNYDPKKHVMGEILSLSCDSFDDLDAVALFAPTRVHNVSISDLGNGLLKVDAKGEFYAPGLNVLSGNSIMPATNFDGSQIVFFGAAKDLLQNDALQIVGADGTPTTLAIATNDRLRLEDSACGLKKAIVVAEPHPDENSTVTLSLTYGRADIDAHSPLVVIGNKIFGLRDSPFYQPNLPNQDSPCTPNSQGHPLTCSYTFDAPTDLLRSSQVFAVKDLAWGMHYGYRGTISIHSAIDNLSLIFETPAKELKTFLMSGKNVKQLVNCGKDCPVIYAKGDPIKKPEMTAISDDSVFVTLPSKAVNDLDSVKINVGKNVFDISLSGNLKPPDLSPTPSFLSVGDSLEVSFAWSSDTPIQVKFEDTALIFHLVKKTLKVGVTTVVTKSGGQKQLRATMPNGSTVLLPIRVVGSGG